MRTQHRKGLHFGYNILHLTEVHPGTFTTLFAQSRISQSYDKDLMANHMDELS